MPRKITLRSRPTYEALASENCSALIAKLRSQKWTSDHKEGVKELAELLKITNTPREALRERDKQIKELKERIQELEDAIGNIAGCALEYYNNL